MLSEIDLRPYPTLPPQFNLAAHVLAAGARTPETVALQILHSDAPEHWTYARLIAAVQGVASGLVALGGVPGDRVLLRLGAQVEFPLAFLGAIAAGLVPVPTAATLTAPEITAMAAGLNPALIVAASGIALPDHAAPVITDATLRGWQSLSPGAFHMGSPHRPGYIVYTSGTSGRPMGVVHAHRALLGRLAMHQGWEGLTPTDRLLHAGAMNWTYTLGTGLLDPWTLGATALIPAPGTRPTDLPALLHTHKATIFAAAPGVYRQMLRAELPPLPHLRHGLSAGEALPATTRHAWTAATGTDLHEALGMTEVSTFVSSSPNRPARGSAMGYAQHGRHIAVLGPDLSPVVRGTPGVLAINRDDPGMMLGTLDGAAPDPWFQTGDLVQMAEDGAITYLGRADDQMNAGGFRVSPMEVEAALATFPGLTDLVVTEITAAPGSTLIACFYTSTAPLDHEALAAFAATCLARHKQPRLYRRMTALPRSANGKLNRRALIGERP